MGIVTSWYVFQGKGDNACIALGRSGFWGNDDAFQKHRKRELNSIE